MKLRDDQGVKNARFEDTEAVECRRLVSRTVTVFRGHLMGAPVRGKFLGEIARLERSAFSVSTGLRAAVIAMTPLAIGFATGHLEFLYATFGAMFVISTEGPPSSALPPRVLLLACFTEATAFALGTLASTTGFLAIPLVGVGVFVALMAGGDATFTQVGTN